LQHVQSKSPAEQIVVITRSSARAKSEKPATLSPADQQKYLAASPVLNHKDPEVLKLAKEAVKSEKDPHKQAEMLWNFVGDYIQTKNLSVGFATASEVARSKEGDCTEHSVLLAALGRAVGIPSRVVAGLVFANHFGNRDNVFVGHMWTQFFLNGEWVDFDAALQEMDLNPTHIALSLSAASDNGVADLVGALWLTMSDLSIEVVKSE